MEAGFLGITNPSPQEKEAKNVSKRCVDCAGISSMSLAVIPTLVFTGHVTLDKSVFFFVWMMGFIWFLPKQWAKSNRPISITYLNLAPYCNIGSHSYFQYNKFRQEERDMLNVLRLLTCLITAIHINWKHIEREYLTDRSLSILELNVLYTILNKLVVLTYSYPSQHTCDTP